MKKKHLFLVLRILVAAAGLAYIGFNLNWSNKVEAPAGAVLRPGDAALAKKTAYRVVSGDFDPVQPSSALTIEIENGKTAVVEPEQLGAGEGKYLLRPGIFTTLRHANLTLLVLGLLIVMPIYPIQAVRWRMLLRSRGLDVSLGRTFRLVMIGSFFNYAMPGSTGGDVVKAYYAAKRTDRRADAIMSVIFDRIVGLLGLVFVASLAGVAMFMVSTREWSGGFAQALRRVNHVTAWMWICSAAVIAVSAVYFSRRLRELTGLEWLLSKLLKSGGLLSKVDQAAVAYRDHKMTVVWTILMSLPLQLGLATSTALAGFALGIKADWLHFGLLINAVPVLFLVAAIPISYQGFGFMEGMGFFLLAQPGVANENQIVIMLLVARLFQIIWSMTGSVFLLGGDIHMHPEREGETEGGSAAGQGVTAA